MTYAGSLVHGVNTSVMLSLPFLAALWTTGVDVASFQPSASIAPSPLPPPGPSSHGEEIIRQFTNLSRSTRWNLTTKIKFEGDSFEPEGLARLGHDRYFVSAVERTIPMPRRDDAFDDDTDGTNGEGIAHMIVFDGQGVRLADSPITEAGALEYHIGGIDYDGTWIWATLAQYRPNSTATLVRLQPDTLRPERVLRIRDHMGAVVHDRSSETTLTLNWGSRAASLWIPRCRPDASAAFSSPMAVVKNPSHYVDYQDCKFLGRSQQYGFRPLMLCSGITNLFGTEIGGVALVDMQSMIPLYEVPLEMVSDLGVLVTKNPMDVAVVDGRMRFFFLADERNSTLYVYEPQLGDFSS